MTDNSQQTLGALTAQVADLRRDVSLLHALVREQSAQLNRWRGAGAVLILVGASVGAIVTVLAGLLPK